MGLRISKLSYFKKIFFVLIKIVCQIVILVLQFFSANYIDVYLTYVVDTSSHFNLHSQNLALQLTCRLGNFDANLSKLMEQELHSLPEHLSSPPGFRGFILPDLQLSTFKILCRSLFVRLQFSFWSLQCLAFFPLRLLISLLVSSKFRDKSINCYLYRIYCCNDLYSHCISSRK